MRNKFDLRLKKEYNIDWNNRRKGRRDNRARKFQALGNRRARLQLYALDLIYDKKTEE